MAKTHKVCLIGSGMMTKPLIDYLVQFKDTHITIASNMFEQAKELVKRHPDYLSAEMLDVTNYKQVLDMVSKHTLVISFIPPWMHMHVHKPCLEAGVNVVTSSYISPQMLELDAGAKAKGLVFLNECGLDPGIDIMGTMKVVHEAHDRGLKVVGYRSYCGGIPVADQADNPLGYKFSWNPGAAIKASRNTATYMQDGKRIVTTEPLKSVVDEDFSMSMKFEVFPNRDSTVFMDRFQMKDCETFVRGTFRYEGWSAIISAFHDVGITSDDAVPAGVNTLRELCNWRFTKVAELEQTAAVKSLIAAAAAAVNAPADAALVKSVLSRVDVKYFNNNLDKVKQTFSNTVKTMKFLGFFDDSQKLTLTKKADVIITSSLDAFSNIMAAKMSHEDHDRDLVVMRHIFTLEDPHTKERFGHTSTMIKSGDSVNSGGFSIMSTSVGVTTAMGVRLVLEGKISQRGVISVTEKEVYEPILQGLEKKGIVMVEESERPNYIATKAKL